MGERKVLNNYISPDFDPSIIPKFKRNKDRIQEIRMMLPFSMQCNTCGEYMYRGTKFNSKKEDCKGEDYMGIRRFRFYIKCTVCSAEITFKTDPKNSDYECESGASRNFEVWRDTEQATEAAVKEREEEDAHDTMKALENRTLDSKIEMDVLDALDEIKAINQRHERVDTAAALAALQKKAAASSTTLQNGLTAEDEALIKSIKFKSNGAATTNVDDESTLNFSTKDSERGSGVNGMAGLVQKQLQQQQGQGQKPQPSSVPVKPLIVLKKRKADVAAVNGSGNGNGGAANKVANTGPAVPGTVGGSASVSAAAAQAAPANVSAPAPTAAAAAAPVPAASMFGDYGEDSD